MAMENGQKREELHANVIAIKYKEDILMVIVPLISEKFSIISRKRLKDLLKA